MAQNPSDDEVFFDTLLKFNQAQIQAMGLVVDRLENLDDRVKLLVKNLDDRVKLLLENLDDRVKLLESPAPRPDGDGG